MTLIASNYFEARYVQKFCAEFIERPVVVRQ